MNLVLKSDLAVQQTGLSTVSIGEEKKFNEVATRTTLTMEEMTNDFKADLWPTLQNFPRRTLHFKTIS
jgi:hypothetical protein